MPIDCYERQGDDVEVDANMCITDNIIGSLGRATLYVDVPKWNWKRIVSKDRDGPSWWPLVVPMAMNVKEKTLK